MLLSAFLLNKCFLRGWINNHNSSASISLVCEISAFHWAQENYYPTKEFGFSLSGGTWRYSSPNGQVSPFAKHYDKPTSQRDRLVCGHAQCSSFWRRQLARRPLPCTDRAVPASLSGVACSHPENTHLAPTLFWVIDTCISQRQKSDFNSQHGILTELSMMAGKMRGYRQILQQCGWKQSLFFSNSEPGFEVL